MMESGPCRLGGGDAVFVIGYDEQARVNAFPHLAVYPPSRSLSQSAMPQWRDAPNGFAPWLIVGTVSWERSRS
jgi:hypothetical protein